MPATAEEISKRPEVRQELERTSSKKSEDKVKAPAIDKFWFVTHGLLLIGCAALYYLIGSKFIPLSQAGVDFSRRILRGVVLMIVVLATAKAVRVRHRSNRRRCHAFHAQADPVSHCRDPSRHHRSVDDLRELVRHRPSFRRRLP